MKENYLHTTSQRLKKHGARAYRTDQMGAVIIESDGKKFNPDEDVRSIIPARKNRSEAAEDSGEKLNVGL